MDPKLKSNVIEVTVDANWAGCLKTRRSTGTINCSVYGTSVHLSSKTQPTIAQSSAHSELAEIQRGARFGVYFQTFWYCAYGETLDIEVSTDSAAGKTLANMRGVGRVRHLEVKELHIQELTNSGRVRLLKVPGKDNVADIGTKVLDRPRIDYLLSMLNVQYWDGFTLTPIAAVTPSLRQGIGKPQLVALLTALLPQLASGSKVFDYDYYEEAAGSPTLSASSVASTLSMAAVAIFVTTIIALFGFLFVTQSNKPEERSGLSAGDEGSSYIRCPRYEDFAEDDRASASSTEFSRIRPPTPPRARPTTGTRAATRNVLVQSPDTYKRRWKSPRFRPLGENDWGAVSD